MAIPRHVDEAVAQLKDSAARIDVARAQPLTLESLQAWLIALTEFSAAVSDIQAFNNESVHEKLHELAARTGLREFSLPGSGS